MRFANPQFFWLLFLILTMALVYVRKEGRARARLVFSSLGFFKDQPVQGMVRARHLVLVLRLFAIAFLVAAIARPQEEHRTRDIETYGVDIMLAIDASGSMQAEDFEPENRLGAAKAEARKFILGREHDRMGLVVFAGESYTQCPLTLDYDVLIDYLNRIEIGMIEDGTAIGLAITNAVSRLEHSDAKSRVIVLLTDGVSNAGQIDPLTAAQVARSYGIKIYTIGAGQPGALAPFPVEDPVFGKRYVRIETEMDEKTLKEIADTTGGAYFRAKDEESLAQVFQTINDLEKSRIVATDYVEYSERFGIFVFPALASLGLELVLSRSRFRTLP
ncbi:MAG: VWA domain-containing protein [Candidatus Omnitrophica bacterium]|nr:VWA domain-containing protein [Candidatus Omnitrophota bacterium]